MSERGELSLPGCKTASVLENLGMRVGLVLPFGIRALVGLQPRFRT
jgi:hypothetical protein